MPITLAPTSAPKLLPTWRQSAIVLFIALQLSWLISTLVSYPFLTIFLRFGFLAAVFLLVYSSLGAVRWRFVSSGVLRLLGIALAAPVASMLTFAAAEGPQLGAFLASTRGAGSFVVLTLIGWIIGLNGAGVALHLERKASERAERLRVQQEKDALERSLLEARLRLLQAQIEPHFLFNTLANVQALVDSGSPQASPVLRHLIAYLRAAMPHLGDSDATLGTELGLVQAYLELMRMRMPDRLSFSVAVDPALLGLRFPVMALLTLVENAVRHGIDPAVDGGHIDVGGTRDGAACVVWVRDTGAGMGLGAPAGHGLANVRTRLQAAFGDGARLALYEPEGGGVRAELHFTIEGST